MAEPEVRGDGRRIWLIDRREYWRQWACHALEAAGFAVRSWDCYACAPEEGARPREVPDLVVLACTLAGEEELSLVERIAAHRDRVLVLASSVPSGIMRSLFRAGASDVTEMPASPGRLVASVEQTLISAPAPSTFGAFLDVRSHR